MIEERPCPSCAKQIAATSTSCPLCNDFIVWPEEAADALSPSGQVIQAAGRGGLKALKWTVSAVLGSAGAIVVLVAVLARSAGEPDGNTRMVLNEWLAAPSQAQYQDFKMILSHRSYRVAFVRVDAPNAFGVMLRKDMCVGYRVEGDRVKWNRLAAVRECTGDRQTDVRMMAIANEWTELLDQIE